MRKDWFGWVVLAGVATAACGGAETTPTQPATTSGAEGGAEPGAVESEVDVAAIFARESESAELHDVSLPDGSLRSRIESSTPPVVSTQEGFVAVVAQIAEHGVQCFIYPDGKDGGEVARVLISKTLDEAVTAANRRWIDVHGDQVDGWPYLVGRAQYLVQTEGGNAAGGFKIAVSVRDETTIACLMDAPGYYASFERVVKSLLQSMDSAQNRGLEQPMYDEISRLALPGQLVAISRSTRAKDGRDMVETYSEMQMMIGPEGSLRTSDEAYMERSRAGRVVSGSYASVSMGQVDHHMELSGKGGRYTVSGTVQDKPIEGSFEVKGGLPDEERSKDLVCEVHRGKRPEAELPGYKPAINPQAPSSLMVQKSPTPDAHLLLTMGDQQGIRMTVHVDDDCDIERGTLVTAGASLAIERLWHREKR